MRKKWNPQVLAIPHGINITDLKLNIEEMANYIYDLFCQLQKKKSNLGLSENNEFKPQTHKKDRL